MVKIMMTGDNHFGKKYDRYADAKDTLVQSRFDSFKDMIRKAEEESCDFFVVTGDMFDKVNGIAKRDIKKVAIILSSFSGSVLVLPGNHDYYTGNEEVWKNFKDEISSIEHNITILDEYRPYEFEAGDESVKVYPAFCDSKHSKDNRLGWIKETEINKDVINIGIAHGAIQGVTPDMKQEYFMMSENELDAIPVDVWLIGHTHITYPSDLPENAYVSGYKVFNAGTHEQTDLNNNTEGNSFILNIEKHGDSAEVSVKRYLSGRIRFFDMAVKVSPESDKALHSAITSAVSEISENSIVRLKIAGVVKQEEYEDRFNIYNEILKKFISYEIGDAELSEEITLEKIHTEYAETSFAAMFLEKFIDNSKELNMVYELLNECRQ